MVAIDSTAGQHALLASDSIVESFNTIQSVVPIAVAYRVNDGAVPVDALEVSQGDDGQLVWRPSAMPGTEYRFAQFGDSFVLAEIRSLGDGDASVSRTVRRFEYDRTPRAGLDEVPPVPTRRHDTVSVGESPLAVLISGDDAAKGAELSTTHELVDFAVITTGEAGYVDPGDTIRLVRSSGEFLDYEGNVVGRIDPARRTTSAFQWTAVAATVTIAAGLAAIGVFVWQRRSA